jgi:hypothetical protein
MDKALHITAILDQPGLLEDLVEKLAHRRYDIGYSNVPVPRLFEAIETSSTETYVSGTISLALNDELINMPFITCFLFTCSKIKGGEYKLGWGASLS